MSSTQTLRQRPAGQKPHPINSDTERAQDLAAKLAASPAFVAALQDALHEPQPQDHAAALEEARRLFPEAVDFEIDSREDALRIGIPPEGDYPAAFMRSLDLQDHFDRFGLALHPFPLKA